MILYSRSGGRVLLSLSIVLATTAALSGCGGTPSTDSASSASNTGTGQNTRTAANPVHTDAGATAGTDSASGTTTATGTSSASGTTGTVSSPQAAKLHANELGKVPVLEYHQIVEKTGQFYQTPAQLRSDLKMLWDNGFQTLDIHDYLNGNITTTAGKSPVVLTFDDASPSQFRYISPGKIDPDCAVGILEAFKAEHPDFGSRATFFVLPEGFSQRDSKAEKYKFLVEHGYTLGNHTTTHDHMTHMTPDKIQYQLGFDDADIQKMVPNYTVDVLAYPNGTYPKTNNKMDTTYIEKGNYKGHPYHIRAAFLVGAEPAPSPYSQKLKPYAIPRIQAIEDPLAKKLRAQSLAGWIHSLVTHPKERFISDGDPGTVSVPKSLADRLNPTAVASRKVVTW